MTSGEETKPKAFMSIDLIKPEYCPSVPFRIFLADFNCFEIQILKLDKN